MNEGAQEQVAQAMLLSLYLETPLRAGMPDGALDESLVREKASGFPYLPAAALKGAVKAEAAARRLESGRIAALFGGEVPGALCFTDVRLALFPVRSASGVFAWATCPLALARLRRDIALVGGHDLLLPLCPDLNPETLYVPQGSSIVVADSVVLEEFSFKAIQSSDVGSLAEWFALHLLPQDDVFEFWRAKLCSSLAIVHDEVFRDFVTYSTEVTSRLAVDAATRTAKSGPRYEEHLPGDTLLYSLLIAEGVQAGENTLSSSEAVLEVSKLGLEVLQLGAGRSLGKGLCRVRVVDAGGMGG